MKKTNIFSVAVILIWAVLLFFNLNQCTSAQKSEGERLPLAKKTSFYDVTAQLNPGGSLYLYASTEGFINAVEKFAGNLRKIIETRISNSPEENKKVLAVFDFVYGLIKKSGLMEISGIGVSSVALEENLNHSKIIVHHYKDKGKGLIWQLLEGNPHQLSELNMLPADTVMAGFADCKLNILWGWIKKQAEAAEIPELKQGILSVEPQLQQIGVELKPILDSLTGIGYIISLDNSTMQPIPIGGTTVEIPDPALAIVFQVKDETIFNLLQSRLPIPKTPEEKDSKKINIPVPPMPFTVAPVIVQKNNMLIFASNSKILDALFTAKEKGNGLTTTGEFKNLSVRMPAKGNSFRYVSERFVQTILDIQKKIVQATKAEKGDDAPGMEIFDMISPKMAVFGVLQNTPEGTVYTINHTMSIEGIIFLPATVAAGIIAAIAVPNLLTKVQNGKQKAAMGDMKSAAMAIESYIVDHNKVPEATTFAELKDLLQPFYIKVLPLKDPWGNDYLYYHGTGDKKNEYAVGCGGKDGIFNGWDQTGFYVITTVKGFDNDIIIANGQFTYSPKVK